MDFNDIQSAWDNDKPQNVKLPSTLEQLKSAQTPLDQIKKNLKNEFYYQFISIALLGLIPFILPDFPMSAIVPFYLLFAIFVAVCVYYLIKLYIFYKRLGKTTLNTRDSLYETYFDIRINMELYKTFGFALTPFIVLFTVGFLFYQLPNAGGLLSGDINNMALAILFFSVITSILTMGLALEWWVKFFYGKYADELKKVINALKEE